MFRKDRYDVEEAGHGAPVVVEEQEEVIEVSLEGPIVLDLAEVRDEIVMEGWHSVTIERAEARLSRQKKSPQIFILSRVTDEADVEFNRTIIWNVMLKGDGMLFTKRCFKALNLPEQLNYPTYQALADNLIGLEVEVRVKHRTYKGEKQYQCNSWRPITLDVVF